MARHWAETVAKTYLLAKGYELLAENYTVRGGELDLVMRQDETIVFVEVRQRKSARYGSAAASITKRKLERLRMSGLHFLVATFTSDDLPVRFDAILITGTKASYRLEHIEAIG